MKKIFVVMVLSGCSSGHPHYCPEGYVPAEHKVTKQKACFKGGYDQVPTDWWQPMPEILVR
jgi:hypothetical protein